MRFNKQIVLFLNNSWQEFVDNYRTFAADIDSDIKRVRELLDKLMIDSEFVEP